MTKPQRIFWHGTTSEKKARSIIKNGFRPNSWFARHLEDALEFGGRHVLAVVLRCDNTNWQVCLSNAVPPEKILWYEQFTIKRITENTSLGNTFFGEDTNH